MKRFAALLLASALALAAPVQANEMPMSKIKLGSGDSSPQMSLANEQYAQVVGYVCRNGLYYCYDGFSWGYIGNSCCGCGMCGWWSTW